MWVDGGLSWGQNTDSSSPGMPSINPLEDQTTEREHSPTHQQKIGLKVYWAWPWPPEKDLVFPTANPSHQDACTSLFSSSIRGQREWSHNHRKLTKMSTYITVLCNNETMSYVG